MRFLEFTARSTETGANHKMISKSLDASNLRYLSDPYFYIILLYMQQYHAGVNQSYREKFHFLIKQNFFINSIHCKGRRIPTMMLNKKSKHLRIFSKTIFSPPLTC
jgi:hypothetical protein